MAALDAGATGEDRTHLLRAFAGEATARVLDTGSGMLGGFITGLVLAMCASSYLYFIAGVVNGNRMHLRELGESWRPYFGSVINILFLLFIVQYALALLTPPGDQTALLLSSLIELILLIILNPIQRLSIRDRSRGSACCKRASIFSHQRRDGFSALMPPVLSAFFFLSQFLLDHSSLAV
jgi:hypothetical protein